MKEKDFQKLRVGDKVKIVRAVLESEKDRVGEVVVIKSVNHYVKGGTRVSSVSDSRPASAWIGSEIELAEKSSRLSRKELKNELDKIVCEMGGLSV